MTIATLDISEARREISRLEKRLTNERVIWITRHNKKAFAVVNPEVLEAVLETLEIVSEPETLGMLQKSLEDIRAGRLHDHDKVRKEML